MYLKSSQYSPKYSRPQIAHHSNLSPNLDSTISNWSRIVNTMAFSVLDQVTILDFQLGTDLNDEHFLGHCILDLKTLSAICFNANNQKCMAVWTIRIRCLICCSRSWDTNMGTRITSFYNTILAVRQAII